MLIGKYPNCEIGGKYAKNVFKCLTGLLDDKKRVVRKFARYCVN